MDDSDVEQPDPNLRKRLERRIVNNNETILKIDYIRTVTLPNTTTMDDELVGLSDDC